MEIESSEDTVFLKGFLDESVNLNQLVQALQLAEGKAKQGYLKINFAEVAMGNSVGILNWLKAIEELKSAKIVYSHAPKWLVGQLNMVPQFMANGAVVESFEVPFFCEEADEEITKLFIIGKDIDIQAKDYDDSDFPPIEEGDKEYTLDVLPKNYFRFISDHSSAFEAYFKS